MRCLKEDKDIALVAVKSNPATIEYVSSNMKNDIDVVSITVAKGGADLIKFADFSLSQSIHAIFNQNLELINYVPQQIISGDQNLINIQEISQLIGLDGFVLTE